MSNATTSDIQKYNYMVNKANDNDIIVNIDGVSFALLRKEDGCILGKFCDVRSCYDYVCGYEAGYEKGIVGGR